MQGARKSSIAVGNNILTCSVIIFCGFGKCLGELAVFVHVHAAELAVEPRMLRKVHLVEERRLRPRRSDHQAIVLQVNTAL